jgi:hypothetical protein
MDLLPGWEAVKDTSGDTYFWNRITNETTWEKPTQHKKAELSINSVLHSPIVARPNPKVYFEIRVGNEEAGRIEIEMKTEGRQSAEDSQKFFGIMLWSRARSTFESSHALQRVSFSQYNSRLHVPRRRFQQAKWDRWRINLRP